MDGWTDARQQVLAQAQKDMFVPGNGIQTLLKVPYNVFHSVMDAFEISHYLCHLCKQLYMQYSGSHYSIPFSDLGLQLTESNDLIYKPID